MRIKSIHLRNFKRFSDLLVRDIPSTAKLVVVVGPNGCGKSSLFDALLHWYRSKVGFGRQGDEPYFRKSAGQPFGWNDTVQVELHGETTPKKGSLYVRTAYRNDPDFSISSINRTAIPSEEVRFGRFIENDQAVAANYQRLVYDSTAALYDSANDGKMVEVLREELIGGIRASMLRVFGDLILQSIQDPLGSGAFFFEKGEARTYHYKNLSGGEKAAFDLLLDLHIKRKYFPDAVYCIDEVDSHLHTSAQGALLCELVKVVPQESQLWVTSHSLGVLRAAQELEAETPGSVCILDFDGVEPDVQQELMPAVLGRVTWEKLLSVMLDDLSERIAPRVVFVCEGSTVGTRRKDFDARIYNQVLGSRHPDVLFISGGPMTQVEAIGTSVREILRGILPSARVFSVADRDEASEAEVAERRTRSVITLARRNLESYLLADDVIEALVTHVNQAEKLAPALEVRRQALASSVARGNPADDLKSAAGEAFVGLKALLGLTRAGNDKDAFMRDTLAPLLVPGMQSYDELAATILGGIA